MPALKGISGQWLKSKHAREKKSSLGLFDEKYLTKTRVAAVFCGEKPVAFANLWETRDKNEMSVDLMRYGNDAPSGVMEYLFVKLMLMGQEEGFQYFNLGMAPLSGIDAAPYSPLWNKVAGLIYKRGSAAGIFIK
jgi:phosphatidylglycerol lysyltransferase